MSIKKSLLCGALTLTMLGTMSITPYAKSFPDASGHWAETAIGRWSDYGVVNGDDQGNFRPGDNITRAETATVLDNLIGYKTKSTKSFSDVSANDWFFDAISKLNYANVMTGYEDGTIRPKSNITRQEAAVMIARATGLKTSKADLTQLDRFKDKDSIQDWAKESVALMTERGYLQGNDGSFRPADSITRAEVVTIINNIVGIYANGTQLQYTGDYGDKLAIIKTKCTLKGVVLGGAVISPQVTGSVIFNNAAQINGCLYDLSESATVSTSGASVDSTSAPYKRNQNTGSNSGSNWSGGGSSSGGSSSSSSSTTKYTVKFDANGGRFDSGYSYTVTCKTGDRFSSHLPSEPKRDGYIFDDWYTTEVGANTLDSRYKLDSDTRVTANKTLYAGWIVDDSLYASVKAATGTIKNKKVSDLMDVKLTGDSTKYTASGTLYYVRDFDYPAIDPSGNYLILTYKIPSSIKKPENVKMTMTFGTQTVTYDEFTSDDKTYTHIFYISEDLLKNTITFKTELTDSTEKYDDITVDISKLKLAGHSTVTTEEELKTALADSSVTAITVNTSIELKDGQTYAPTGNVKKAITLNAPFILPKDAAVTIKNLSFNTGKKLAVSGLFEDNCVKSLIFEGNSIDGAYAAALTAKDGNYTIKDNTFKNSYTTDGGFTGADMTEQYAIVTSDNGSFNITGNTFEGYTKAISLTCAADKLKLEKNIFKGNSCDVNLADDTTADSKESMYNLAYNFYDDGIATNAKTYIAYPVYTDEECTKLSDNLYDAWLIAKTEDTTAVYSLNAVSYIPFEDGKTIQLTVLANDARSTSAEITKGSEEPAQTVTITAAATPITVEIDKKSSKEIVIGHTSTEIEVKISDTLEGLETAAAITADSNNFSYDAKALDAGSKLYIKVKAADSTQKINALTPTTGDGITFNENGIAEVTLRDATTVYTIDSVTANDGTNVAYTITISK